MKWNSDDEVGMAWVDEVGKALDENFRRTATEIFERRGFVAP